MDPPNRHFTTLICQYSSWRLSSSARALTHAARSSIQLLDPLKRHCTTLICLFSSWRTSSSARALAHAARSSIQLMDPPNRQCTTFDLSVLLMAHEFISAGIGPCGTVVHSTHGSSQEALHNLVLSVLLMAHEFSSAVATEARSSIQLMDPTKRHCTTLICLYSSWHASSSARHWPMRHGRPFNSWILPRSTAQP